MKYVAAVLAFLAFIVVISLVWDVSQRRSASHVTLEPQSCIAG